VEVLVVSCDVKRSLKMRMLDALEMEIIYYLLLHCLHFVGINYSQTAFITRSPFYYIFLQSSAYTHLVVYRY